MRTITRFVAAILAAIGLSAPLLAVPAASWVNFGGDIDNNNDTITCYGSSVNTATVTNGTWDKQGGYLTLGTSEADGTIALTVPSSITGQTTVAVTVMLDVEAVPETATLLSMTLANNHAVGLQTASENTLKQVDEGGSTYGSITNYTSSLRSPRQIITFVYSGGASSGNGTGTITYINGIQKIADSGLKYGGSAVNSITIGAVREMKVYGIYLFASTLSAGEVSNEIAAARAEIVPDVSVSMTRNGAANDNTIKVATLRKGATSSVADFEATFGTTAARSSANPDEAATFFKGSWSSCVNTNVKSGYPMVCNKFTNADSTYYWRLWVPITLESTDVFNEVLPELYPTTSGGDNQGAAANFFDYTISLYGGTVFEGTTAEPIATATGTTSLTRGLNTARAALNNAISGRSGAHTLKIEVTPNACGDETYSGIRSVHFFNRTTASRTVSGDAGTWSTDWTDDVAPIMGTDVTLNVSDAATLSMDTAATLSSLMVNDRSGNGSASLTFSGAQSLASSATTLDVSTDVSAITSSLGAVTVASGKKFTVGANTSASSLALAGTTLATKGEFTVSEVVWGALTASTAANRPAKLLVESGTLALKANVSTSAINYAVEVAPRATLDINGVYDTCPSSLTLGEGATLCNGGNDTSTEKIQWTNLVLAGDATLSGNTFASIARSWASQSLTLGGHTLTVDMSEGKTFYLSSAGARKSAEEPDAEAGTVKVTSGTLSLFSDKNADSLKRANVVLAGGTLKVEGKGLLGSLAGESGTLNLSNDSTKDVPIGDLNKDTTFAGAVSGSGIFHKVGTGTQTLSGDLSGFTGAYVIEAGKLILPTDGTLALTNAISGAGTLVKSGTGALTLSGAVSTPVELAAGSLDLGTSRPAVTVTGTGTTLVLLQGLDDVADDVTRSPISLSFADGIESCTVETKSLGGATKRSTIFASDVPDGTVSVTFPTESGTVDDTLPTAHRTCGFENTSLSGLDIAGYQNMTFTASPFPGQGNYGQITTNGRPYSPDNNNNEFRTETGARGFTFSLKVCPHTCANKGVLLSFGKSANAVALLWQDKNDTDSTQGRFAVYSVLSTGDANTPIVFSQWVTKDAWHAVSVVSSLETRRFYITVDGQMAKSEVLSNGLSITNGVFQVGSVHGNAPSGSGWTDGVGAQVDDFRFDKVPLAQTQIAQLLFHYAKVSADSALTGLTEFGSGTQVAWAALKATADARISVADGVTATATLTAPTAATLKVWGAGTLEVAKGESAQRIAAVELKEANTTLLLHRSQAEVVTLRVGTVGTFKFDGGTTAKPLEVPYNVAFPGAIAVAADSCVKLECTTGPNSGNVSYQVSGAGQSSKVILTSDHPWGVLNTGSVTSLFSNLTLSIGGERNFWIRAGLTDNVWLEIQPGLTVTQEGDNPGTTDGVLTVRNLTGGGIFTTSQLQEHANKTLRLLNTDAAASTFNGDPTINDGGSNFKLVFAGNWTVGAALTDAKTPPIIHIGDGSTATTVETAFAFAPGPAYTVQANATLRPTAAVALPASLTLAAGNTLAENGKVQLTLNTLTLPSALAGTGTVLFGNGTDTFAYTLASAPANFAGTYNVAANSTLTLTSAPNGNAGFAGSGTLVIGDGTVATNFTSTKAYPDALQPLTVQVKSPSKLTLDPGADNFAFPNGVAFDVASGAELILASGMSFFGVSGEGSCSVTGDYLFGVSGTSADYGFPDAAKVLDVATLTLGNANNDAMTFSVRPFGTIDIAPTTLTIKENVTVARNDYYNNEGALVSKGDASISLASGATLSGTGTIELPVDFTEGAVLDTVKAAPLLLKGKVTGTIKVKLDAAKAVLTTTTAAELDRNTQLTFASDSTSQTFARDGYRFVETQFSSNETVTHTFTVMAKVTLSSAISAEISGSDEALNAIYNAVAVATTEDSVISTVTAVKVMSTDLATKPETSNPNALALFENLYAWATPADEPLGDGTYAGTVTVYYDFGISQLHVKRAALNGEESAPLYVLLCAKVATLGKVPANYAKRTTVTLYKGEAALNAVEPTKEQLEALGLTPAAGEKWFAVPMSTLGTGTHAFKVKASKTTTEN